MKSVCTIAIIYGYFAGNYKENAIEDMKLVFSISKTHSFSLRYE